MTAVDKYGLPVWDDTKTFSPEWYRRRRDWHLATYPDCDQVTRDNLDMLVRVAEEDGCDPEATIPRKASGSEPSAPPNTTAARPRILAGIEKGGQQEVSA